MEMQENYWLTVDQLRQLWEVAGALEEATNQLGGESPFTFAVFGLRCPDLLTTIEAQRQQPQLEVVE